MSPTSQGALEVERYIGSCLISTNSGPRPTGQKPLNNNNNNNNSCRKQQQFVSNGTWAGGAPLISMAANPRRNIPPPQQQKSSPPHHQMMNDRVPLSRLAVHTQGAPLILSSNRYHNNNNNNNRGKMHQHGMQVAGTRCHPSHQQQHQRLLNKPVDQLKKPQVAMMTAKEAGTAVGVAANIDSLSIASDESSGSNNSENSLPRIIKPRKRRKKDRKPPLLGVPQNSQSNDPKPNAVDEQPVINNHFHHPVMEQQQQQHHQSQQPMKSNYQSNTYEPNTRCYPGDNPNYFKGHRRPNNNYRNATQVVNCFMQQQKQQTSVNNAHEVIDTRQQQHRIGNYAHRHVQVKVLDDNRNVILPGVPVCQQQQKAGYLRNNAAVAQNNSSPMSGGQRYINNEPPPLTCHPEVTSNPAEDQCPIQGSLCQCRYCDPATLIWDVSEQNRYSPHYFAAGDYRHHHHHHRFSQIPATVLLARPVICQEHPNTIEFFDVENPCLRLRTSTAGTADGAAILRRSWSDPTSYFSEEIVPNRDVGVIGDRGGESSKSRSSWRGDAGCGSPTSLSSSSPGSPGGPLEVSTEIVTSPNGHRDLEIKFYSSSPTTSYAADDSKNAFTFPDDDDNDNDAEEFSDIWSYHESKLQQDFRTLLQAEE